MPTTPTTWDPLNSTEPREEEEGDRTHGQDRTIIVEEGDDVVDSNGKLIYPDDDDDDEEEERKPVQRRTSHLRLDLKPHSPLPWEQVNPPLDNNLKAIAGYYSPVTSHKFRTLQSSGGPRPLIPKSSYYFGPPPPDSAYGTRPVGQIGVHHPREILRVERDYTGGELIIQFAPIYPLELEGRITPTHFLESINSINELLISAHSLKRSLFDNLVSILSLQVSRLFLKTHFEKEMMRLRKLIDKLNAELYNPVGLNMLWPGSVAFLYLEIEYY
ncbi:Golgin subfamily A member 7/ERF4 family-domain-containing protein [Gymnopilus junonius]|uniref:Ras modification protein ERF4 n=1 Tax=Gymnopilus junonius TaxID=109634 RepID=A0A9P5TKW5_GYMJU|nr:Golgin subfamily A member 7/ERF4 family-domain-containing protein [Gymnopilus junonius]